MGIARDTHTKPTPVPINTTNTNTSHARGLARGLSLDQIPLPLDYPITAFILDATVIICAWLGLRIAIQPTLQSTLLVSSSWGVSLVIVASWLIIFWNRKLYQYVRYSDFFADLKKVLQAVLLATVFTALWLFVLDANSHYAALFYFALSVLALMIIWRGVLYMRRFVKHVSTLELPRKTLLICSQEQCPFWVTVLKNLSDDYVDLVGVITDKPKVTTTHHFGDFDLSSEMISNLLADHRVDNVVIALSRDYDDTQVKLLALFDHLDIPIYVSPAYDPLSLHVANALTLEDLNLVLIQPLNKQKRSTSLLIKRVFDIGIALAAIIITFPVQMLVICAIKLDSPGPVLYIQQRKGTGGKHFNIYKFRSMRVDAHQELNAISEKDEDGRIINHKRQDDPRVTRVGKIIRKMSLDELPQLFNVLIGDMSLVGPRPELMQLVDQYEPWQHHRFDMPQGITGWWQVNGRSSRPCHRATDLDMAYINEHSVMLDVQIIAMTIPAIIKGKGAF